MIKSAATPAALRITLTALGLGVLTLWMSMCITKAEDTRPDPHAKVAKRPVIAVLPAGDAGSVSQAALVQARLSQNDGYVIADREHIEAVAKEWDLAALSTASTVSRRVEAGRLLGADLLVLLAERATPAPHYDVVISETTRGLRLRVENVPKSKQPEDDTRTIEREIEKALAKRAEGIAGICAVPPFVSMDLTTAHDPLKTAYARMLEETLLRSPGMLVVEIAEARALAEELVLTGTKVERHLPIYFLGEYRFDAANPAKPPYLRLTAKRGERAIGTRETKGMTPATAAPYFREAARELLGSASGEKLPPGDSKAEAQTLAHRAKEHFSLGYYEEAAQVAEASFLLEPKQPDLHQMTMLAYTRWNQEEKKPPLEAIRYYYQALVHLEHFLLQKHFEKLETDVTLSISLNQAFRDTPFLAKDGSEETKQAVHAFHKRMRESYLRVLAAKQAAGTLDDPFLHKVFTRPLSGFAMYGETLEDNLRKRLEVVPLVFNSNLRNPGWFLGELLDHGISDANKQTPEYAAFLDQLHRFNHPAVQAGLARLAEQDAHWEAKKLRNAQVKDPVTDPAGPAEVEFLPVKWKTPKGSDLTLWGLLNCGESVDLLWGPAGPKSAFLMKSKGVLETVFEGGDNQGFGQACFDGKYAWLPVTGEPSAVLAIDPATSAVVRFTAEDGLPEFRSAASATLGQGKLCLSAMFGGYDDRRTYIAVLELLEDGKKKVRIIHEATRKPFPNESWDQVKMDPQRAYVPEFMFSKPRVNGKSWQAMVARAASPSLLIDPDLAKVELVDADPGSIDGDVVSFDQNGAYWGGAGGLYRIGFESLKRDRLRDIPENLHQYERVIIHEGRLHVIGWNWWIANGLDQPFRKLEGKIPGRPFDVRHLFVSSHYGIVFKTSDGDWKVYQVKFRDS